MARNQRKQSDYEESYHESDYDDDCAENEIEYWVEDNDDDESGDSEDIPRRRRPRLGQGSHVFTARSVGCRESMGGRKKLPPPSLVRPHARKPRLSHEQQRERRTPQREREQPYHGPHFLDKLRRGQTASSRKAGQNAPPDATGNLNEKPVKRVSSWGRFFLLLILLACGTAYTFHATTHTAPEGNVHKFSEEEGRVPSKNAPHDDHADEDSDANANLSVRQNAVTMRFLGNVTTESSSFLSADNNDEAFCVATHSC